MHSGSPGLTAPPPGRLAGLDGLRAIAIGLVVVHNYLHKADGRLSSLRGGYLGVTVFFVLSGFLISSLLLVEEESTGRVRFGSFYLRRAYRLLPAMLLALAFLLGIGWATGEAWGPQMVRAGSVLGYVFNWWHGSSPLPDGWGPLWSLSVEEQFYLVWPLLLAALLWLVGRRATGRQRTDRVAAVTAVGALGLAAWRTLAWWGGETESPLYNHTHFRADALLIGAALAVVVHGRRELMDRARAAERWFFPVVAAVCVLAVVGSRADPESRPGWMLGPGMTLVAVLAAVMTMLAITAPSGSPTRRVLDARWMVWIGTRSYAIYLLHEPMAAAVGHATGHGGAVVAAVSLVLTLAVAEASYRWLEQPVLRRLPGWARRTTPALPPAVGAAAASG
ncbi:MAG: acyltransferase [Ilumatobacter sp.]|nr:acyltransferase [Ilumatobacter sp.]